MTPEELFDEFIQAYLHVLRTGVLLTLGTRELINTSLDEFVKPWCEKVQSMMKAAQAEQRRKDATKAKLFEQRQGCGYRCGDSIADDILKQEDG